MDINPLTVISLANIYLHAVGRLFVMLMVSFAVQKLLSLSRSHLFIFAFVSFALVDRSKKILLQFMQRLILNRLFIPGSWHSLFVNEKELDTPYESTEDNSIS